MPISWGSSPSWWIVGPRIILAASFRPSLPWSTGISSRSAPRASSSAVPRPRVGRSLSRHDARSGFVPRRSPRETAGVRSAPGGGLGGSTGRAISGTLAGQGGFAARCISTREGVSDLLICHPVGKAEQYDWPLQPSIYDIRLAYPANTRSTALKHLPRKLGLLLQWGLCSNGANMCCSAYLRICGVQEYVEYAA